MASKLPKLVLPAYNFRTQDATYRHYAEAVFKANPGSRGVTTKDALDRAWFTAVKNHWPGNQAKREELFRDASSRKTTEFWKKSEEEYLSWFQDPFRGTRTLGTVRINRTNVSLPNCDLEHLEYVRFATTTLPQVNPRLECTREIVDDAWTATVESQKFKNTPRKVKDAALAQVSIYILAAVRLLSQKQAKSSKSNQYWKTRG